MPTGDAGAMKAWLKEPLPAGGDINSEADGKMALVCWEK